MKRHLLLYFLFFIFKFSIAQDTIVKNNGDVIQAKITEITPTEVKYKKFTFQDGPTYVENKSELHYIKFSNGLKEEFTAAATPKTPEKTSAPEVYGYGNGSDYYDPKAPKLDSPDKIEPWSGGKYKYHTKKIGENEMQKILLKTNDKEIVRYVQNAKDAHKLQFIGFAAIPLGIGSLFMFGSSVDRYGNLNSGKVTGGFLLLGGSIACPILSGVFKHKRTMNNRKAVELYNQKF